MSLFQTESDIFPIVAQEWDKTPVVYPNMIVDNDCPYIDFEIAMMDASQVATKTSDDRPCRSLGDLIGSLYLQAGQTMIDGQRGSEIAEEFNKMLSAKRFGKTRTFVGRVVDAGYSDDKSLYRYNIIIPYQTDTAEN